MSRSLQTLGLMVAFATLAGGCAETAFPTANGKGDIRGINAISAAPATTFLIEEQPIGIIDFRAQASAPYDDLTYNLNFDLQFPGDDEPTRLVTESVDVQVDTEYTLVLTGTTSAARIIRWEQPVRRWEGNEAVVEVAFGHLASTLGDVDVYFDLEGIVPVMGAARASLAAEGFARAIELPADRYVATVTPKDDPATRLYQTTPVTLPPAIAYQVVLFDPDTSSTSSLGLRIMSGTNGSVAPADVSKPTVTRLIHAAFDAGNVDTFVDGNFTTPLLAGTAFGVPTTRTPINSGPVTLSFTPAGNTGSILLEQQVTNNSAAFHTLMLTGAAPNYIASNFLESRRSIETVAQLKVFQGSTNQDVVDIYLLAAGQSIAEVFPLFFSVPVGGTTEYLSVLAGTYDLAVTPTGDATVLAQLPALTLAKGQILELAVLDTADPNVLGLLDVSD